MPMDGFTLGFVARELDRLLAGGRIDRVAQPERDELILTVRNGGRNMLLLLSASADCARAHITDVKKNNPLEPPALCMLLRKRIVGGRVTGVTQIDCDRILEIGIEHRDELGDLTCDRLVCEFMGRHSNLILVDQQGRIADSARRVNETMSSVREVLPGLRYERPPAHGKIPFDSVTEPVLFQAMSGQGGTLRSVIARCVSGMSAVTAAERAYRATGNEDAHMDEIHLESVCASLAEQFRRLPESAAPGVLYGEDGAPVDVNAFVYESRRALQRKDFSTLSEALDEYYRAKDQTERIRQKSQNSHRVLKNNIERCRKKLALQNDALQGAARMDEYRRYGELITASQHLIRKGMKVCALPDYYAEGMPMVDVPLDEKLSPAQNAQRYFKLYQKARSAKSLAAEQIQKTGEELYYLEGQMENLEKCEDEPSLAELRAELEKLGYVSASRSRKQIKQLPPSVPMKFTSPAGRVILVGKNNLQNDKLTFTAEPGETWLHAKDMPGSHVIIPGDAPDDETLLFAARVAAKYSKGGTGSHVPVDYTLRKYVKKPSGAKPGFVIYTHQRTLYVDPITEV